MPSLLTAVSLLLSASTAVVASPCVAFDVNWNLLAFGFDGKDYNAGTQGTWTSTSNKAADITTSGRPSFDGTNTTCFLSEYTNAIYVLNGDSQSPSSIYIYDATAKSWSTQAVTTNGFNPASFNAILDHDTNLFYAISGGNMFSLDMGLLKAANSSALGWVNVKATPYPSGYQPVMALAQNHIHFLDVPGVAAGSAMIFVIHYAYFQPEAQSYPASSGGFPSTYGQATSFFQQSDVQQEFAFIPEDSSAVYVVNVETNTTQMLAGPTTKDPKATYFASMNSLVQLTSNGAVSYLPYTQGNNAVNSAATWATVNILASVAPPSSTSPNSTGSPKGTSTGASGTHSPSSTGTSKANDAMSSKTVHASILFALVAGAFALML